MKKSYKDYVIYQIYPRSFCDTDGDGIGDINGITQKLQYIKSLGADAVWLCPVYCSPNADYGYDISDYTDINPEYGTMKDFDKMLKTAHTIGLKVVMDLVINHTSDQHNWFLESKSSKDSPYRDYYIWRPGKGKHGNRPPNNWTSFFTGKAWTHDKTTHEWYLHLFAENQPDLNYRNPELKREIKEIIKFWLDKGVDGFRCDVITLIGKKAGLPNGKRSNLIRGIEHFKDQPETHEVLKELKQEIFDNYDCFTVGESVFITVPQAVSYTNENEKQLDMVFSFDHMNADNRGGIKYFQRPFRLKSLKEAVARWQTGMFEKGWNANYFENHDQPRIVGRYCSDKKFITEGAKMIAILLMTLTGTPFIYQGQEIGMTNIRMADLSEYRDIETKRAYELLRSKHFSEKKTIQLISLISRDNARTPMQWSGRKYADFSTTYPWIKLNPNYPMLNVENQEENPDSILNFYRKLIELRNENEAFVYGEYVEHFKKHKKLFVFEKRIKGKNILVILNFSDDFTDFKIPRKEFSFKSSRLILSNMPYSSREVQNIILRPYEALIYEIY